MFINYLDFWPSFFTPKVSKKGAKFTQKSWYFLKNKKKNVFQDLPDITFCSVFVG